MSEPKKKITTKYSKNEELIALTNQLEEGVKNLFKSTKYKEYLNTMSKFHSYSANNVLLILNQNPEATFVAGYKKWRDEFHRHVKKDEQSIKIIAPVRVQKYVYHTIVNDDGTPVLQENGKPKKERELITHTSFKISHVYDISQTHGQPLPTIAEPLKNNIHQFESIVDAIREASPVPIEFRPIKKCNGYYSQKEKYIAIKEDLSEEHKLKTIFHEMAHSTIHDKDNPLSKETDSRTKEVQAESIAYVICQHFGIDSSDYSFGYVASWSSNKELKDLKQSLSTIQKTSNYLISNIEIQLLNRNLTNNFSYQKEQEKCQQKKLNSNKNTMKQCKPHGPKR